MGYILSCLGNRAGNDDGEPGRDAVTVLKESGEYSEEHVRQLGEICSAFFSSDLMKRVKRLYCEVPFIIMREGQRVTGTIDRLLELDNELCAVIDYKSEAVGYAALVEEYRKLMEDLLRGGEELTGKIW
ncbi:hypothetical protein [Methanoregula sp.]|uniref:hypothetical protein n=1 Tax=Methanoregula sp. TaxID=2052170 RepID=UPI0035667794